MLNSSSREVTKAITAVLPQICRGRGGASSSKSGGRGGSRREEETGPLCGCITDDTCNTKPPQATPRMRVCTIPEEIRAILPNERLPPIPVDATATAMSLPGFARGHTKPARGTMQFADGLIPLATASRRSRIASCKPPAASCHSRICVASPEGHEASRGLDVSSRESHDAIRAGPSQLAGEARTFGEP